MGAVRSGATASAKTLGNLPGAPRCSLRASVSPGSIAQVLTRSLRHSLPAPILTLVSNPFFAGDTRVFLTLEEERFLQNPTLSYAQTQSFEVITTRMNFLNTLFYAGSASMRAWNTCGAGPAKNVPDLVILIMQ